jgi:O-antigen/teichoic acid export membrane protein
MSIAAPSREKFRSDVAWNFASLAFLGVSGLGLNVLIGRTFGPADLGIFNQVWAVYIFFSQLAVGGIDLSVLKEVAAHRDDRERVFEISLGALLPAILLAVCSRSPSSPLAASSRTCRRAPASPRACSSRRRASPALR